jgi:hypothetical protein
VAIVAQPMNPKKPIGGHGMPLMLSYPLSWPAAEPAIHLFQRGNLDGRIKPGHDKFWTIAPGPGVGRPRM